VRQCAFQQKRRQQHGACVEKRVAVSRFSLAVKLRLVVVARMCRRHPESGRCLAGWMAGSSNAFTRKRNSDADVRARPPADRQQFDVSQSTASPASRRVRLAPRCSASAPYASRPTPIVPPPSSAITVHPTTTRSLVRLEVLQVASTQRANAAAWLTCRSPQYPITYDILRPGLSYV